MINYNRLKEIQRKERINNVLTNLPPNFYEECANYFIQSEQSLYDEIDIRKYQNAYACFTEIVEKRLSKITNRAYFKVLRQNRIHRPPPNKEEEELPTNIPPTEAKLYETILNSYDVFYKKRYVEYLNLKIDI